MSKAWWDAGEDRAAQIWSLLETLETRQRARDGRNFVNEKIYGGSIGIGRGVSENHGGFMPAALNYTRTIVDALVARVGNGRPAVRYAADGASWSQRRKAKQYDRVIEGEAEALGFAQMGPMVLRDCLVTSGGIGMVTADCGRIVADRVPCEELRFPDYEARYGKPRQMHRVMRYAKEVLAEKFDGKARDAIENAPAPKARPNDLEMGGISESAMVEVAMSWHLPSSDGEGKKATDGRYVISIPGGATLDVTDYKRSKFPIAVLRWSQPRRGYWGASLVDELAELQFKVNEIAHNLQQNVYFTSALKVAVRRGAQIPKKHLAGKKPHFFEVDAIGSDVQWIAPDGFSLAQFQFLQWHIQQMFEISGVSQLMAQGKNPLGAGASGAALNEVYEQDSERFSQLEQGYARWWCDMGELVLEAARDLADDAGFRETEVRWGKNNVLHKIKWADVDLEADRFELHLEPSGYMPQTRAGKMQAVEQLVMNGMLDPKWAASLVDYPDLKRAQMVQNAPLEWCLWAMEQVTDAELTEDDSEVDEGKSATVPAPDPHMDLELAMAVGKAAYQIAVTEGTPEPILARFVSFIDSVDAEKKKLATGAPPPPPPDVMGMPPMDPMAGAPVDPMAAGLPPMPPMGVA